MEVIELIESMRIICKRLAQEGNNTINFVPTMGSLHAGHGSLIKRAKEDDDDDHDNEEVTVKPTTGEEKQQQQASLAKNNGDCHETMAANIRSAKKNPKRGGRRRSVVIVSIFVNPIQFNQREDFLKYPQTLERDLELCQRLKVDYVFVPRTKDIFYGQDQAGGALCLVRPPEMLANQLEGRSRRGHFEGMLTIVCKLFNIITPNRAYFGEKDYQQLILVKRMVKALNMDVTICPVETVRDPDYLPLSSRNVRLNDRHRRWAVTMYDILIDTKRAVEDKCRLNSEEDHNHHHDRNCSHLETIILSSMLATQCLAGIEDIHNNDDHHGYYDDYDPQGNCKFFTVDYLELRCSRDLTTINYKDDLGAYDCQDGCVAQQLRFRSEESMILKARLLIAVIVGGVRLLDNIEVKLNLSCN